MNTELNSPISDSRHHNNKLNQNKMPKSTMPILIIVALVIFLMGIGMFFYVAKSDQPDEQSIDAMDEAVIPASEEY